MRVSLVRRAATGGALLAVSLATAVPAGAATSTWSATPALQGVHRSPVAAVADDGTAAVLYGPASPATTVRTGSARTKAWTAHALRRLGSSSVSDSIAAGPGGAVAVARNRLRDRTVSLEVRRATGAPWHRFGIAAFRGTVVSATIAHDPTGGWVLATEEDAEEGPRHVVVRHLGPTGIVDELATHDLGAATLPTPPGRSGRYGRSLQVDASGRTVIVTGPPAEAAGGTTPPAVVHVRPHGGTFAPGQPYGTIGDVLDGPGITTSLAGRTAVFGTANPPQASSGAAGTLPGPFPATPAVPGPVDDVNAAPVGQSSSVVVWSGEAGEACGGKGRPRCGAGGAIRVRIDTAQGAGTVRTLARAGGYDPVAVPLSRGRALIAWEQDARGGHGTVWHARLVTAAGKVSATAAPRGAGSGANHAGGENDVRTAGDWALATWGRGPSGAARVTLRRF
jgi:hypothetical protein